MIVSVPGAVRFAIYTVCVRTGFTMVPPSRNSAIRFGIDINTLKVSATPHSRPRSTVAPRIATAE